MKTQRKKFEISHTILLVAITIFAFTVVTAGFLFFEGATSFSTNDKFLTTDSVTLYAGTGSNYTFRGTAALVFKFSNPGVSTGIASMEITGASLSSSTSALQCSNKTSCANIKGSYPYSAPLAGNSVSNFGTNTTAFYISQNIIVNQTYDYVVNFATGESVSGSIVAQTGTTLPAGPIEVYSNTNTSYTNTGSEHSSSSYSSFSSTNCDSSTRVTQGTYNMSGTLYTTTFTLSC